MTDLEMIAEMQTEFGLPKELIETLNIKVSIEELYKYALEFKAAGATNDRILKEFAKGTKFEKKEPTSPFSNVDIGQFFIDGKFHHELLGDYLINYGNVCKIKNDGNQGNDIYIYDYDEGVYKIGPGAVEGYIMEMVNTLKSSVRREVVEYIKNNRHTRALPEAPPNLIPFKTMVYDIDKGEHIPYSPDMVFLNRFPVDYDPDATDTDILEIIRQIADYDQEVMTLLMEAIGYTFYRQIPIRFTMILCGTDGRNGKSTLLNIIRQLIGANNSSSLSLQDLQQRFRLQMLHGKAINMGDDLPTDVPLTETGNFKTLATGGTLTVERKGQDAFSMTPYAKLWFATNGVPPISDKSDALYSRLIILPLNHRFTGDGDNTKLKDHIWSEADMKCLCKHAIEDGLIPLLKRGRFSSCKKAEDALDAFRVENDSALAFINEFIDQKNPLVNQPIPEIYQKYKDWCSENGFRNPFSLKKFSSTVCKETGLTTDSRKIKAAVYGSPSVSVRCFVNPVQK